MKKILMSLITISLVSVIGIGATRAYFSDQGTSTGNTFSAGTLDLKLTDNNETDVDEVDISWVGNNMVPGGAATSGAVQLKNSGTVSGDHVKIVITNDCTPDDMDEYFQITLLSYEETSIIGQLTDVNDNGWIDLDDFENDPEGGLDNLLLQDLGVNHPFGMSVGLRPETGDDYQGGSCSSTLTFTLNQHSSQ